MIIEHIKMSASQLSAGYRLLLALIVLLWCAQGSCDEGLYEDLPPAQYVQYANSGYYIGTNFGFSGSLSGSNEDSSFTKSDEARISIPVKLSGNVNVRFGRKMGSLRSELEFSYILATYFKVEVVDQGVPADLPDIPIVLTQPDGTIINGVLKVEDLPIPIPTLKHTTTNFAHIFLLDVNFYYDFLKTFGPLTPYVGIGGGYIVRSTTIKKFKAPKVKTTGGAINLQGMLGFEYNLKRKFALLAEFRYIYLPDSTGFENILGNFRFNLGTVFRFG